MSSHQIWAKGSYRYKMKVVAKLHAELQMRRDIENNLKIFFLILTKTYVVTSL